MKHIKNVMPYCSRRISVLHKTELRIIRTKEEDDVAILVTWSLLSI